MGTELNYSLKSDRGFTLLEMLIAMAIFLVGIMAYMQMQEYSTTSRGSSSRISQAVQLAQSEMERQSSSVSAWHTTVTNSSVINSTHSVGPLNYNITTTVRGESNFISGGKSVWDINVVVDWGYSGFHSVRMQKLVIGT